MEQEKSTIDMKITEMAAKNAAEMAKEKSFRKLEDVRIDGVRQKLDRLRSVVKNGENALAHEAEARNGVAAKGG